EEDESEDTRANLEGLLPWMEGVLDGQVASVRRSTRLTESAAVLVDADDGISSNLERILKQANQDSPMPTKRVLEINSKHPLIRNLATLQESGQEDIARPLAELLLDEARLIDGTLEHAAAMGRRVQSLLERVAAQAVASANL
ncbi:MAG: HSP90 family molecular chaperone, partial [Kiritimatiellia bacterium]